MNIDFKVYDTIIFIFSNDMSKVVLLEQASKLDGIFYRDKAKISPVEISKKIKNDFNLEIEPRKFRTVVTLQNIDKIQHVTIMMTLTDIEKIKRVEGDKIKITSTNQIPDNCIPQLKWLIPMAIDVTIYGCEFNQVLTK